MKLAKLFIFNLNDTGLYIIQILLSVVYGGFAVYAVLNPSIFMLVMISAMGIVLGATVFNFIKLNSLKQQDAYSKGRIDQLNRMKGEYNGKTGME